ncbi:MAG: Rrf2 family transcriptional regulator [Candidatus Omnitrophica bacterium]|nr:Rrf2 family transcriptional regulator [Candidatus Omnitrophota bacterium]
MKISAKTDYACRALLELALSWPKTDPVPIALIAKNQEIPIRFLTHILVELKTMGLVDSLRGQKGGYVLIKSPKDITIKKIVEQFSDIHSKSGRLNGSKDVFVGIWIEAQKHYFDYLERMDFEEILALHRKADNVLMYSI